MPEHPYSRLLVEGSVMVWVAVLLLPFLSVMLLVADRVEERLFEPAPARRRHAAGKRHLRLIRGGAGRERTAAASAAEGAVAAASGDALGETRGRAA
ncbi:hypothetical protein ACIF8T_33370 [Streptomyces sp. NPDC085946]|uniref:hypothetical protein n=1 Tax=Streptomyces sp. NPDC085946 TaxID=3365744 RepID=UPI0037CE2087